MRTRRVSHDTDLLDFYIRIKTDLPERMDVQQHSYHVYMCILLCTFVCIPFWRWFFLSFRVIYRSDIRIRYPVFPPPPPTPLLRSFFSSSYIRLLLRITFFTVCVDPDKSFYTPASTINGVCQCSNSVCWVFGGGGRKRVGMKRTTT